ncbi:MAG: NAD(P)-binding domain-containing protein [Clostridia bacterium]|nr:NAD(P)-binding domain-containing protein [Clostridia bacterium]
MKLIALGGDARMLGALEAAKRAGWESIYVSSESDLSEMENEADAVLLPWPHSFRDDLLCGTQISKTRTLESLPACVLVLYGSGVEEKELSMAAYAFDPSRDEVFLRSNARITAEGAIWRAMQRQGRALLGATVLITGFGRIAQELTLRLVAMGSFVIVCARNELQMRRAHELGAHPVPLCQAATACRQADVIFSTVPAHVLGKNELDKISPDALVIELASPPYGMNVELARHMGVNVALESGVPGRYAPMNAGAALFDVLERQLAKRMEGSDAHE